MEEKFFFPFSCPHLKFPTSSSSFAPPLFPSQREGGHYVVARKIVVATVQISMVSTALYMEPTRALSLDTATVRP